MKVNKVVNVPLIGGIIGLLSSSPQNELNKVIQKNNAHGWHVVQIIPSSSGNVFLNLLRLVLLVITLLLFTYQPGYYITFEKEINKTPSRSGNPNKKIF